MQEFIQLLRTAFVAKYFHLFFLLTPFFVFSVFLTMTENSTDTTRRKLATEIALGASCVELAMFLGGAWLMSLFGITVDAFRAGSGVLLLLCAVSLVYGQDTKNTTAFRNDAELLKNAVVPLAVPITAGPATLGTMIVMGLEHTTIPEKLLTCLAIVCATWTVGLMLFFAIPLARIIGRANIAILSKITGLILSAIAVSMIVVGVRALWMAQ